MMIMMMRWMIMIRSSSAAIDISTALAKTNIQLSWKYENIAHGVDPSLLPIGADAQSTSRWVLALHLGLQ